MPKGSNLKIEHEKRKLKIVGQKFNMLTVLYEDGKSPNNSFTYTCRCDCGNERKNIPAYEVAKGRIKSCGCVNFSKRPDRKEILKNRILSRVEKNNDCWEWKGYIARTGYAQMKLQKKIKLAHRLSYELFIGDIPENSLVLHKCDNRKCVNPDHLFLGSHFDNTRDMCEKNRQTSHGRFKPEDIKFIREEHPKTPMKDLAQKYGVNYVTIMNIINKKTWKYA